MENLTIDQLAYYLTFQKFLKDASIDQFQNTLRISKFQFRFRKGYSTQDCLLDTVENCKNVLDHGNGYGTLLTDLSKAFDCLPHNL